MYKELEELLKIMALEEGLERDQLLEAFWQAIFERLEALRKEFGNG